MRLLKSLFRRPGLHALRNKPRRFPPRLEALEDRLVPTTLPFSYLQPGFTQELYGVDPSLGRFLTGSAFAPNGDVLTADGGGFVHFSQTSTTTVHGSTIHNGTHVTAPVGIGIVNHPDGTIYANSTEAVIPFDSPAVVPSV
jgi:hypothetical protein